PKEHSDSKAAKSSLVTALCAIEAKIKIALRSSSMHFSIHSAIVRFLVNHQAFRTGLHNRQVILRLHRTDLDRNRKICLTSLNAFGQIVSAQELRMLASDQQHWTNTLASGLKRFREH